MLRILIFLLSILFVTYAVTVLASLDGRIQAEAFGLIFDGPAGLIVGGFFTLVAIIVLATVIVKNLMRLPEKIRAREAEARRARGMAALTRGLEAVAVGDASDATHHARVARRHLDEESLTRLLTAQAAQMSGDDVGARENYAAMLEAPETEFLGLRGLYLQAMARDDHATARQYAERAFKLRANAKWAFDSVFDLALDRGAWGDARDALAKARKNNLLDAVKIDRADTVLLTADASAIAPNDEKTALKEALAAVKLSPAFTPAAVLAARLQIAQGRNGKATQIIENAFAAAPHPALVAVFDELIDGEETEKRAERLHSLASKAENSREAKLLAARREILLENWEEAISLIEPLLADAPTTEEFKLMAKAFAGAHGEAASRGWLERAATAPRDPRPGVDGAFYFSKQGWAQLVREYRDFGRLSPPPLEDAHFQLTRDEVRLLTAPPAPAVEDVDTTDGGSDSASQTAESAASEKEPETPAPTDAAEDEGKPKEPTPDTPEPTTVDKTSDMSADDAADETERAADAARTVS